MAKEEVIIVFEMPMAEKVWALLEKLKLNSKELEANFHGYYQGRRFSDPLLQPRLIFLEWGEYQLQPIINRRLNRDHGHPTFYKMMEFCLSEEIEYRRSQYSKLSAPSEKEKRG